MSNTARPYEAPALRESGQVVPTTQQRLVKSIEADMTPLSVLGSVGFGV